MYLILYHVTGLCKGLIYIVGGFHAELALYLGQIEIWVLVFVEGENPSWRQYLYNS